MAAAEIICISSDEEENSEEKDKKNEQSTVIVNKVINMKEEVTTDENKDINKQKRKASQMESVKKICTDKKLRLSMSEEIDSSIQVTNSQIPQIEKNNKAIEKPKLIVKEKKSVNETEQDTFPMFISLCLQKDRNEDMKIIVNKLKRRYEQLNPTYASSKEFADFLNEKRNAIMNSNKKLYVYINEVMNEMKSKCLKQLHLQQSVKVTNSQNINATASTSNGASTKHVSTLNNTVENSPVKAKSKDNEIDSTVPRSTNKKIRIILKTMEKCERVIKRLEEEEVNFSDEDDSTYMKLERYKHRMVELHKKLCEFTGENPDAGRPYLRPKHLSLTRIVAVDQAITSFINANICKRNKSKKLGAFTNALIFPDYRDILECVKRCNDLHDLGLTKKKQHQLAKEAFTELGKYLQLVRRNDYWDTFSLFLENKEDDPALKNEELAEKLGENRKLGEKKLSQIFEDYVKKQEAMKNDPDANKPTSEDEEDEESSLEDENEDKASESEVKITDNEDSTTEDDNESTVDKTESRDTASECTSKISVKADTVQTDQNKLSTKEDNSRTGNENAVANNSIANTLVAEGTENRAVQSKGNEEIIEIIECTKTNNDKVIVNETVCKTVSIKPSDKSVATSVNVDEAKIEIKRNTELGIVKSRAACATSTKETEEKVKEVVSNDCKTDQGKTEDKPLLRVCSFAKPPTTWDDTRHKADHSEQAMQNVEQNSEKAETNSVIDLTKDTPKLSPVVGPTFKTVQISTKLLPIIKGKCKTLMIRPTGHNIIHVKNVTNNYVKVNAQTSNATSTSSTLRAPTATSVNVSKPQVIKVNCGPAVINVPTVSTAMLQATNKVHENSKSNTSGIVKAIPLKQNGAKLIQIIQPNKSNTPIRQDVINIAKLSNIIARLNKQK